MSRSAVWAAAVGVVLVAASCTNVPSSSPPEVVQSVQVVQPDLPTSGPSGADLPRTIVSRFLDANAAGDTNHNGARQYLTAEERNRWSDGAGTTIITSPQISNPVGGKVTVSGREVGTISDAGVYTPTLQGDGSGTDGLPVQLSFGLVRVKGHGWRINSLQPGLVISQLAFDQYQQRVLYFFDGLEQHLVPDLRYAQVTDPQDLEQWLITGLAQGPRDGLANGLPNQIDPKRARVSSSDGLTDIEIPGASGLNVTNRDRLGAQVAATLAQTQVGEMQITDGGAPVRIPAAGGTTFSSADMVGQFGVDKPETALYYVNDGAIFLDSGRRLPGKVGTGSYALTSAALSPKPGSNTLMVAAERTDTKQQRYLDVGTADQLIATKLHGALSRPAWAPDVPEVWVGDGPDLYRVSPTGVTHVVPIDAPAGSPSGTVTAVRLSPEGSRVAIVLKTSASASQIYVGSVVRSSSDVRVTNLSPISPQGIAVQDVAWNDQLKLFVIGTDLATKDWGLYEVQCDGSLWTLRTNTGLSEAPDSLTVTENSVAVVSTPDGYVWQQQAGSWEPLVGDYTFGANPVYVE